MADAGDLKSPGGNPVRVRVPPPAPCFLSGHAALCSSECFGCQERKDAISGFTLAVLWLFFQLFLLDFGEKAWNSPQAHKRAVDLKFYSVVALQVLEP